MDQVKLKRELKKCKVPDSKLHRQTNRIDQLLVSHIYHYLNIYCSHGHSVYYGINSKTKQQSIDICPIPFQNGDTIKYQIDNKGNVLVALQPTYPLHYILYPIKKAN